MFSKLFIVPLTRLLLSLSEHSSQPGFPHCLMKDRESLVTTIQGPTDRVEKLTDEKDNGHHFSLIPACDVA